MRARKSTLRLVMIKEGHMNSYYIIVKSEVIFVNGSVKSDMWERKRVPCAGRMCKPECMRSHEFEEKHYKTLRKREKDSKSFV